MTAPRARALNRRPGVQARDSKGLWHQGTNMLWQRLVFGALMIAAVAGVAVLDGWVSAAVTVPGVGRVDLEAARLKLLCGLPTTLLVVGLVVLATYELGGLCEGGGHRPATHWAAFVGALLAVVPWLEMQYRLALEGLLIRPTQVGLSLSVFLLAGGVLGTCLVMLLRKKTEGAIGGMATTLLLMTYLGLLASFVVRLRCMRPGAGGAALVVFFILTVKSSDIGAYFVGKFLGKHKLAPRVSPGKTVEGVAGGMLLACGVALGGLALWRCGVATLGPAPLGWAQAIVFALVMAIAGQLGDLVESGMKRDAGNKDSGQVVPAFGGLLDIIDSVVFTGPIAWWLLTRWAPVG